LLFSFRQWGPDSVLGGLYESLVGWTKFPLFQGINGRWSTYGEGIDTNLTAIAEVASDDRVSAIRKHLDQVLVDEDPQFDIFASRQVGNRKGSFARSHAKRSIFRTQRNRRPASLAGS
jgi:hypothetical protein